MRAPQNDPSRLCRTRKRTDMTVHHQSCYDKSSAWIKPPRRSLVRIEFYISGPCKAGAKRRNLGIVSRNSTDFRSRLIAELMTYLLLLDIEQRTGRCDMILTRKRAMGMSVVVETDPWDWTIIRASLSQCYEHEFYSDEMIANMMEWSRESRRF